MSSYAVGKHTLGICDRCGFTYKLHELRRETVNLFQTDFKVCPECWDPDQPQNLLGRFPITDAQAVRDPRPDTSIVNVTAKFPAGGTDTEWSPIISNWFPTKRSVLTVTSGPITLMEARNAGDPAWSPDGMKVTAGMTNEGESLDNSATMVDRDGENEIVISPSEGNNDWQFPTWSHDGKTIVMSGADAVQYSKYEIYTITWDSGEANNPPSWDSGGITMSSALTATSRASDDPSFTLDDQTIVFSRAVGPPGGLAADNYEMMKMDADGENEVQLTDFGDEVNAYYGKASHDGESIIYSTDAPLGQYKGSLFNIWQMGMDGSNNTNVTGGKIEGWAFWPSFSPDQTKIAYSGDPGATTDLSTDIDIYVVDWDGKNSQKLTETINPPVVTKTGCTTTAGSKVVVVPDVTGILTGLLVSGDGVTSSATTFYTGVKLDPAVSWSSGTDYSVNDAVQSASNNYICTQAGLSGSVAPSGEGTGIIDGGVIWSYLDPDTHVYLSREAISSNTDSTLTFSDMRFSYGEMFSPIPGEFVCIDQRHGFVDGERSGKIQRYGYDVAFTGDSSAIELEDALTNSVWIEGKTGEGRPGMMATGVDIDASSASSVSMRISRTAEFLSDSSSSRWSGRLYWNTSDVVDFELAKSLVVSEPEWSDDPDNAWVIVTWDLGAVEEWSGTVDKIRIELHNLPVYETWSSVGSYAIDYIRIT